MYQITKPIQAKRDSDNRPLWLLKKGRSICDPDNVPKARTDKVNHHTSDFPEFP